MGRVVFFLKRRLIGCEVKRLFVNCERSRDRIGMQGEATIEDSLFMIKVMVFEGLEDRGFERLLEKESLVLEGMERVMLVEVGKV